MTEHQRQYAHYAEVKRRLMANAYRPAPQLPANENEPVRIVLQPPEPTVDAIDPDDITRTEYAKRRAVELGYSLRAMKDRSKGRGKLKMIHAKQLIIWEIKNKWPETSLTFLAHMFGLADHSTIFYSIHKVQALKDAGKL